MDLIVKIKLKKIKEDIRKCVCRMLKDWLGYIDHTVQEKWCMANIHLIFMFFKDFNAKKIIINIYGNPTETILKKEELMITRSLICWNSITHQKKKTFDQNVHLFLYQRQLTSVLISRFITQIILIANSEICHLLNFFMFFLNSFLNLYIFIVIFWALLDYRRKILL